VTRLVVRLTRVEADLRRRRPRPETLAIYWDDELVSCRDHPRCGVEPDTGQHHAGVIRLSFGTPDLANRAAT